ICTCQECPQDPTGEAAELHTSINRVLATRDEKSRRRFVGLLATRHGSGGVQHLARVTGLSRTTIPRGGREIAEVDDGSAGRLRAVGGGRQSHEKKIPPCAGHSRK